MRILSMVCVLASLVMGSVSLARAEDKVPEGEVLKFSFNKSQMITKLDGIEMVIRFLNC